MSDWYEEIEKAEQERDAFEYDLAMEYRRGRADAIAEYKENILEQLISYDDYCGYVYMPDIREMLDDAEIEVKGE